MGVAPSRVKEGTGEGQTTDGWQLEGTVEADQRFKLKLGTELGSSHFTSCEGHIRALGTVTACSLSVTPSFSI